MDEKVISMTYIGSNADDVVVQNLIKNNYLIINSVTYNKSIHYIFLKE